MNLDELTQKPMDELTPAELTQLFSLEELLEEQSVPAGPNAAQWARTYQENVTKAVALIQTQQ